MDHAIYPSNTDHHPPKAQIPFVSHDQKGSEPFLWKEKAAAGSALRVAAYIRVSTDNGRQEDSYEIQSAYFAQLLSSNPLWISAGIYCDHGISGTSKDRRIGFNRLLRHCTEGRIDHIVTKSISRFARNTRDFLKVLDTLKENKVTIAFEKEHLNTAVAQNDLLLTIFGAVAQEESRSIAANITTGLRHRYIKGETKNIAVYGYRYKKGKNSVETMDSGYSFRQIEPLENEAAIVRRIFREAIEGNSFIKIARGLNSDRIPAPRSAIQTKRDKMKKTPTGILDPGLDEGWTSRHIKQILRLERYCGDVLLQKTYKPDYKSHKVIANKGELQQYYIKNHHPPIIDRKTFQQAQQILVQNALQYGRHTAHRRSYPLSGKLICSHCGRYYHTRARNRRPLWFCASTKQNNGKMVCHAEKIYEDQIIKMLQRAAIDRFLLPSLPRPRLPGGNYTYTDISPASIGSTMIKKILEKMRQIQTADTMELDRAFLQTQIQRSKNRARIYEDQLKDLEEYWSRSEKSYECRKRSIAWMQTLQDREHSLTALLEGLSSTYLNAFILSIEVNAPARYRVHWFDNTWTNIEMDTSAGSDCHHRYHPEEDTLCQRQKRTCR